MGSSVGSICGACEFLTKGNHDDKLVSGMLKKMVASGDLNADLSQFGYPASVEIHHCELEDNDDDQVQINAREFFIRDIRLGGKLTYDGDEYELTMLTDLQ